MLDDFYLGALVTLTLGLGLVVTIGAFLLAAAWRWVAKYAALQLKRDSSGKVVLSAEVKGG